MKFCSKPTGVDVSGNSHKPPGYEDTLGISDVPTNYQLDKRVSILEQTMISVHKDLEKINTNLNRLVWLMISAIGATVMKWLLMGGAPPI